MFGTQKYSPVETFQLDDPGEVLTGYAAPRGNGLACLLVMSSQNRPIFHARATIYSGTAHAKGLRSGWCGFEIPGVAQAFAVGDAVNLSCGVSGQVLADIAFDPRLFAERRQTSITLTAQDVIRHARQPEMAPDLDHVLPFAIGHFKKFGQRALIEATFMTFLRRWPEPGAKMSEDPEMTDDELIADFLIAVSTSDEATSYWGDGVPGPFNPFFHFDRPGLGPN